MKVASVISLNDDRDEGLTDASTGDVRYSGVGSLLDRNCDARHIGTTTDTALRVVQGQLHVLRGRPRQIGAIGSNDAFTFTTKSTNTNYYQTKK